MVLEKAPFRMYQSEERIAKGKEKSLTLSVRLNAEEQAMVKKIKELLNLTSDGTALKIGAEVGLNVLHGSFGMKILRFLTSDSRKREGLE